MEIGRLIVSILWSKELSELATTEYSSGNPFMSDATFDTLDKEYPTKSVGSKPSPDFGKVRHKIPMGSLDKAQSIDDVKKWIRGLGKNPFPMVVSDKLDGASVSIEYENGKLVRASTRGDGDIGEDITKNVLVMKGVKKNLDDATAELRGEIIIKKSDWHNFAGAANPRNAAAGAAKSVHDNSKAKFCSVVFYRIIPNAPSKREELYDLKMLGLEIPRARLANNISDIEKIYEEYVSSERKSLDYDIDGLVIEIDDTEKALQVGTDPYHPEYAIAFKFPHEEGVTTLRKVIWQVAATGRVNPVAIFDPVNISGAMISRASLANFSLIESKNLEIGSKIVVSRRNDVIPMVERVVSRGTSKIIPPAKCPSCGHDLEWSGDKNNGKFLICPNVGGCQAQLEGAILNYTNKIGVLEWGDVAVNSICNAGLVKNISDIYKLTASDIENLESENGKMIGEKNAEKMIDNLHDRDTLPLHVFVGALGITGIGETMAKAVVDEGYSTIDDMLSLDEDDLESIKGFGNKRAKEFVNGINDRRKIISNILNHIDIEEVSSGNLTGMSFCMTGFRDPELKSAIESAGGVVKSSVGHTLTYLIQKNKNQITDKSEKAKSIGIPIISSDDAWGMIK